MTSVGVSIGNDLGSDGLAVGALDPNGDGPTRLYLNSDATLIYDPVTRRGAWDKTTGTTSLRMSPTKTGRGLGASNSENNAAAAYDVLIATFITDPLAFGQTINGTVDVGLLTWETNVAADDVAHIHLWVTVGDSDTVRGTLLSDYIGSTEWAQNGIGQGSADMHTNVPLTEVDAQAGDRIVAEIGYRAANTVTTSYSGGIIVGGRDGDVVGTESVITPNINAYPWLEFEQGIAFAGTTFWMAKETAEVTPTNARGTWDLDDFTTFGMTATQPASVSDSTRTRGESVATNPYDQAMYRFVSPELAAQTIVEQEIAVVLRMTQGSTDADAFAKVHVYVMAPDESVRGTLAANVVDGTELNSIGTLCPDITHTINALAVQEGDRIVIECGSRSTNVLTTLKNTSMFTGVTTTLAGVCSLGSSPATSSCASNLRFEQTLQFVA